MLVKAGLISDPDDPRIAGPPPKNVAKLAQMIVDAHLDPSMFSDPAMAETIRQAAGVAQGDWGAAQRALAAASVAKEEKVAEEKAKLAGYAPYSHIVMAYRIMA